MAKNKNPFQQLSIFRIIVFSLSTGLYFYVAHQLTRFSNFDSLEKLFIIFLLVIPFGSVLAMPLYFWSTDRHNLSKIQKIFIQFAEYSMAYLNFILAYVVIRDFIGFTLSLFEKEDLRLYSNTSSYLGLVFPLFMILLGAIPIRLGPKVITKKLRLQGLPKSLEGVRVALISDLHISNSATPSHLEKVLKTSNELNADFLALTGDIIDGNPEQHEKWILKLGEIKTKYGIFYCPGNHEYYWDINKCVSALNKTSIKVLINEAAAVKIGDSEIAFAGVADPAARMFGEEPPNWEKIKTYLPETSFKILLCHQPIQADEASEHNFSLQLSGHTHNGQFFPWNILIKLFQKYAKGDYKIGNMHLYVNQGTGYWGPAVRLGTFCEITLLELHST